MEANEHSSSYPPVNRDPRPGLEGADDHVQDQAEGGEHDGQEVDRDHDEVPDLAQAGVVEHPNPGDEVEGEDVGPRGQLQAVVGEDAPDALVAEKGGHPSDLSEVG